MEEARKVPLGKSIRINSVDVNLDDIDMKRLAKEEKRDEVRISQLSDKLQEVTNNLTQANMDASQDPGINLDPSILSTDSQRRKIKQLHYEIEKYQKEITLLKVKLQFKKLIMEKKKIRDSVVDLEGNGNNAG